MCGTSEDPYSFWEKYAENISLEKPVVLEFSPLQLCQYSPNQVLIHIFSTEPDVRAECLYWAGWQVLMAVTLFSFSLHLNHCLVLLV